MSMVRIIAGLLVAAFFASGAVAQRWERLGPEGGQVVSLAAAKNGTVYLGTPDGHVFVSTDEGNHWELRGRAGGRLDGVVQALLVDMRDPQRVYAAIWDLDPQAGGGVFESKDGGRTWTSAGLAGEAVRALRQSPSEPDVLVAGTRTGVFRTADGGVSWQRITPPGDPELRNLDSLAINPDHSGTIYAGTYHLPWKTTDAGKTWAPIHSGMIDDSDVMSLEIDRENPDRIFASACSGIYRSADGARSWTKLQGIPYTSRRTPQILQDPAASKVLYAGTTEGLWISRDLGENWARVTPRGWVINAVAALPSAQGTRILIGTEARGVLASDDSGQSFFEANTGFSHRVISAMAGDPDSPEHFLIQVEGSPRLLFESRDGGKDWSPLREAVPGAGAEKLFGGRGAWWAALREGGAARYDTELQRWQPVEFDRPAGKALRISGSETPPNRGRPAIPPPQVLRVIESGGIVYAVTTDTVWRGSSRGTALHRLRFGSSEGDLRDLNLGPQVCALAAVTIACSQGLAESLNPLPKPTGAGQLIWLQPFDEGANDALFLGTSKGVFRWEDGSANPWKLVESGLPALRSDRLAVSGKLLGLAMANGGFYVSEDGGKSWARVDTLKETGASSAVLPDGNGGFLIGSETEGVLHWIP